MNNLTAKKKYEFYKICYIDVHILKTIYKKVLILIK